MRITGGCARGHRLNAPASGNRFIRPTCDRVREALFNILGQRIEGSICLDLFAGTGAIGTAGIPRSGARPPGAVAGGPARPVTGRAIPWG